MNWVSDAMIFMIPIVGTVALFAFLAVGVWADARRRERESYYRYEFRRRMLEAGKFDANDVRALAEFEQQAGIASGKRAIQITGVLFTAMGAGMLSGLRFIQDEPIWMVGYIPLSIGIGLMAYGFLMAPNVPDVPRMPKRTDVDA